MGQFNYIYAYEINEMDAGPCGHDDGCRIVRPEERGAEKGAGVVLFTDVEHEEGGSGDSHEAGCRHRGDCAREAL